MFSKNDGIVFSFANRKEFKYQSFDMCLALWPAHYRYIRVFSFTASCFKFAKKVLPQLKFKLHTKTRSTSFFIIGSPSISYYNHCVLWLSSFCQEYVCWKKHRVWICRCTSCDLLSWGSNHQPLDNQSAALTTPPWSACLLLIFLSVPPQYHTATTVYRDYLHFARNMYAEKKIVSEHVVALLVMFLWCPRKFIIYEWDPHLIGVNSVVLYQRINDT